jgi:ankyrin repeat protein
MSSARMGPEVADSVVGREGWVSNAADLFVALRASDTAAVARMLEQEPGLAQARNEQGISAVLMACYMGRKEIRDLLIEKGAHLELHEAAAAGNLPRVKELVEANLQLAKSYSPDGFPVLALAAAFGHEEVVRYLHGNGAKIDAVATNGTGYNALTGAVASSHASLAKWLVENGADVNYRYAKGHSPLLEAAANGKLEIVRMLVEHGADPHMRTDGGKNALNFAEERGHQDVADYLREIGLAI